jgi:hypothetical protein
MAHVLHLGPAAAPFETPLYRRIRLASRGFAILFTAILAGFAVLAAAMIVWILFDPGGFASIGATSVEIDARPPPGFVRFSDLGWDQRFAYALVSIVRSAPALLVFWNLRALFRLYAGGVVFAQENAGHI